MVNDKGINERKEIIDPFVIKPKSVIRKWQEAFSNDRFGFWRLASALGSVCSYGGKCRYNVSVTYIIFKIVDMSVGVHVDKLVEEEGLDIYEHG